MDVVRGALDGVDADEVLGAISEIGDRHGSLIQAVDARYVAGWRHLETAVAMTNRALERDTTIADDPAMELLLYVAATRQIDRAIEVGVTNDTSEAVIVVDGGNEEVAIEEAMSVVSDLSDDLTDVDTIQSWFGISDDELAATTASLPELVCERVVLLQLEA